MKPEDTPEYKHTDVLYQLEQEAWATMRLIETLPQCLPNRYKKERAERALRKAIARLNRRNAAYEIVVNVYYYSGRMPHLGTCSPRTLDEAMARVNYHTFDERNPA